jgi:hypothetical protein
MSRLLRVKQTWPKNAVSSPFDPKRKMGTGYATARITG